MRVHERYPTLLKDQREFFDALITEEWWDYQSEEWAATRRFEVASLFKKIQPAKILDLGCGCGFHDQVMAEYPFVREVHAVDYSVKSIERANQAYPHPKVTRWCADFLKEPIVGEYECVVSFQVIEHLEKPEEYFAAASASCAANGFLAVFTPNWNRLPNLLLRLRGRKAILCDQHHFREYTKKMLRCAGRQHTLMPVAFLGYTLAGLKFIDCQPIEKRLQWGARWPQIANCICWIFKKG